MPTKKRKVTELADFTHKGCAGCRAFRINGTEPQCLLKFEQITKTEPKRWYHKKTFPYEPCLRPLTSKAYSLCRQMLLGEGKSIDKKPQRGTGVLAGPQKTFVNGIVQTHPAHTQRVTADPGYIGKVYGKSK